MHVHTSVQRGLGGLALCASMALPACVSKPATEPSPSVLAEPELTRGEIKRTLVGSQPATGLSGWETRLYLIEYGPGAEAPLHLHPVVGVGRVLEGSFASAFGDEPVTEVRQGEGFTDPAGVPHRVFRNTSNEHTLRFVIAYTIQPGQPIFYPGSTLPASGS
jgi:quercetin dioxygenase-like cupin family protein